MRLRFHDAGWPFERAGPTWGAWRTLSVALVEGGIGSGLRRARTGYQNQPPRDSSCWQLRYWAPNSEARDWTFCETFFSHGLAS